MNNKVLYFEGAGCVPRGDVENCRIRTAFTNDEGKKIYLEITSAEVSKTMSESYKKYNNVAFIDYCHYIVNDNERYNNDCNEHKLFNIERNVNFEYTKYDILAFVNGYLNCSFTKVVILDIFDRYRVHKDGGGYNFIEDYKYKPEFAERARAAYNKIDYEIREKLGEKYSKIGLFNITDSSITVRCYASDKAMQAAGLDPKQRYMSILI